MLLVDLTHTSHTAARTGIQRVARELHRSMAAAGLARAVCFDRWAGRWRSLDAREQALADNPTDAAHDRGARWTLRQRWRGRWQRWRGVREDWTGATGLVVPEIFTPAVARALPALRRAVRGPCVAVFHDALPVSHPETAEPATVARFPGYLVELLQFDGIAANSEASREALTGYWRWLGATAPPPVAAIPLGVRAVTVPCPPAPGGEPEVLCVGTLEGRKNHLALLEAAEVLWAEGRRFSLHLVGLARSRTAAAALTRLETLRRHGRPIIFHGPLSDAALEERWARCSWSVYPSPLEGFGLPVAESLARGRPCVCSATGAIGETARGGGTLALSRIDAPALADALRRLLTEPGLLARLTAEAHARPVRTWDDYARDVSGFLGTLARR